MANLSHRKRWSLSAVSLLIGLILGLADRELGEMMRQLGARPGWGTALSVNIVLPFFAVGLAVIMPVVTRVWIGAFAMTAAYIAGMAISHPPAGPMDLAALPALVHPLLMIACLGYGTLGTCTALVTRAFSNSDATNSPASGT